MYNCIHQDNNEEEKMINVNISGESKMTKLKYSHYEYEIREWCDHSGKLDPEGKIRFIYNIFTDCYYQGDIESDEWYETYAEANEAAQEKIDRLEDGPDEPDYDAPSAEEMYQKAHEDRRKLRGY